jgi:hypothetical protein
MSSTIKCVAKRMAGGPGHEHIVTLWWIRYENGADTGDVGAHGEVDPSVLHRPAIEGRIRSRSYFVQHRRRFSSILQPSQ